MADEQIVEFVLNRLRGEAERTQKPLSRDRLDEIYFQYGLSPDQAVHVERELVSGAISIDDDGDMDASHPKDEDVLTEHGRTFADALDLLMYRAKRLPRLNKMEEHALGEAIQLALPLRERDPDDLTAHERRILERAGAAKEKLVTSNLRLVVKLVMDRRFRSRMDIDDLVQHGMIGLMRAADKFDPEWDTRFSTYATWWIRQAVSRGIHNEGNTIRLPVHTIMAVQRLRKARRRLCLTEPRRDDIERIAESLAWTVEYTARVAQLADMNVVSLDAPLGNDDGEGIRLMDLISDDALRPDHAAEIGSGRAAVRELVEEIENERAKDIVKRRFGFDGPDETLQQVGDDYGVTRERIRQIEAKTLRKLKRRAKSRGLEGDSI